MLIESKIKIDELDRKLIQELLTDSRRSVRQLAKSLNESPSTIYNRVKRLESRRLIKKWTVSLDYSLLNKQAVAFVFVFLDQDIENKSNGKFTYIRVAEKLKKIKGVIEIHFISGGSADILIKVRADNIQSIGALVMENIRSIPGVSRTVTNTCFETLLEEWDVVDF